MAFLHQHLHTLNLIYRIAILLDIETENIGKSGATAPFNTYPKTMV